MTELHGPDGGFDLEGLAGYLEELEVGVDAQVTEARLLSLRTQALNAIDAAIDRPAGFGTDIPDIHRGGVAAPVPPIHPADSWPGRPFPLPVPPVPVPPFPAPPLPSPLPMPPLPAEPVPAPASSTPTWREPEDDGRDPGSRGISKRQR